MKFEIIKQISKYVLSSFLLIGCTENFTVNPASPDLRIIYIDSDQGACKAGIQDYKKGSVRTCPKAYIEAGGTYIGFCAGAYYGSHYCEFHKGDTRGYEVLGERELSFFPGSAVGPVLAPYDYQSNSGSRIAQIKLKQSDTPENQIYNVYFNGGCYFKNADQYENVHVLATYNNKGFEGLAAIIECQVGQGKALLCGVHPECSFDDLKVNDQNLSAVDQNHLKTRIAPYLADASHKTLFALLMNRIQ